MRWREQTSTTPVYMVPGEVYEVRVSLWNTSYIVAPGHALRVSISSSNAPRFSVNRNNGLLLNDPAYPGKDAYIAYACAHKRMHICSRHSQTLTSKHTYIHTLRRREHYCHQHHLPLEQVPHERRVASCPKETASSASQFEGTGRCRVRAHGRARIHGETRGPYGRAGRARAQDLARQGEQEEVETL